MNSDGGEKDMKKLLALVIGIVCVLALAACTPEKQEEITTIDFAGEHEYFSLSKVSIVSGDAGQKFNGGDRQLI